MLLRHRKLQLMYYIKVVSYRLAIGGRLRGASSSGLALAGLVGIGAIVRDWIGYLRLYCLGN